MMGEIFVGAKNGSIIFREPWEFSRQFEPQISALVFAFAPWYFLFSHPHSASLQ